MGTHPIFESDFDCLTDMSSNDGDEIQESSDIEEVYDERQLLKQREILERALVAVERQFSTTKQELFKERSQLYEIRIKELKEDPDKNPDLKKAISELQEDTGTRRQTASSLKDFKLKSVEEWFKAEKRMLEHTLLMKKEDEKNKMREKIENKLYDLQDKMKGSYLRRNSFNFPTARKSRKKPIGPIDGPVIIYNIAENEINDDWNFLKKSTRSAANSGPILKASEFDLF